MKIGILTQPLHRNYGGIIQNWALQQTLRRLGHEPQMIHRYTYAPKLTPKLVARRSLGFAKWTLLKLFGCAKKRCICSPFERVYDVTGPRYADPRFIRRHIAQSPILYSNEEFDRWINNSHYDAFVVGSDQVWRSAYSPNLSTYFLDFLKDTSEDPRPRVAYAASFGTDVDYIKPEQMPDAIEGLRRRFTAVSVREDGGLRIAQQVFGRKDAIKTLDPTLLLSADDYRTIITNTDQHRIKKDAPYIAAYILDDTDEKRQILADLEARTGLKAKRMTTEFDGTPMPTISQWLATFDGASLVITDSFHGSVFATIFGCPFIAIGNEFRGMDRFTSLLGMLGIENRLILSFDDYQRLTPDLLVPRNVADTTTFPGIEATQRLNALRRQSLAFLRNSLTPS